MITGKLKTSMAGIGCALALTAGAQEMPVVFFPFREATVASALDTELKEYRFKVGEPFTNGAVIAQLDDARYRVNYLRAREHRDFTARVAKEQQELRSRDFASEMDMRKAEYEARIAATEFADAEISLRRCLLTAPFNGKLAELLTQRYETVKPGQPLYRIIEDERLLAVANLPLGSVRVGDRLSIVPDGAAAVKGEVYEVSPQADNRTGTVRVRILVENREGKLTAGMTGMLNLEASVEKSEPESVPAAAPAPAAVKEEFPLRPAGVPFASVAEAFSGVTPYALMITNDWHYLLLPTNQPPSWHDREVVVLPRAEAGVEVRALPEVAIEALQFHEGKLGYALRRYPRSLTVHNLKRLGELTAGIYDEEGKRIAYLQPMQVNLPSVDTVVTNYVAFPSAECEALEDADGPLRLVMRVDGDVRALNLDSESDTDGGE